MINCFFFVFNNFNHCVKEQIILQSCWFSTLYSIHVFKTKWNTIPINRNIGLRVFKPVKIIGWWNDTKSFINWNICVLESITDIQHPFSSSTHSQYSNVDPELFRMCYWTMILIKFNALDIRTPIFTVLYNKFTCIRTVTFLNTWINERMQDLFYIRNGFDQHGKQKKFNIFVLSYCTDKDAFQN